MQTEINDEYLSELQSIAFDAECTSKSSFIMALESTLSLKSEKNEDISGGNVSASKNYEKQSVAWENVQEAAMKAFHGKNGMEHVLSLRTLAYQHGQPIDATVHAYGSYFTTYRWAGHPSEFKEYRSYFDFLKAYSADSKKVEDHRQALLEIGKAKAKKKRDKRLAELKKMNLL
jgi:hypothetical protein